MGNKEQIAKESKTDGKLSMSYANAFKWMYSSIPVKMQKRFWIIFIAMTCSGFFETAVLGMVAFFASAVTDPKSVLTSKYIEFLRVIIQYDYLYTTEGLIVISGVLVALFVGLKNCVRALVDFNIIRFGVGIETFFGEQLLNGFLLLPYKKHLNCNSADLVNAVQWRTYLGRKFFQHFIKILNNGLMITIMLVGLFIAQPIISFIVIITLGSTAYCLYCMIKQRIDRIASLARDHQIQINKEVTMAIHGIKDVKVNQKESLFVEKYNTKAVPLAGILASQGFYSKAPVFLLEFIGFALLSLSIISMFLFFDYTVAYITGTISLLAVSAWKILPAVNEILNSFSTLRAALPYVQSQKSYLDIIEYESEIMQSQKKLGNELLIFKKDIRFDNVSYAYHQDGTDIIRNFSLVIPKGSTVGIIGASGAGKSTFVDLLIGLLEPVSGSVRIDDLCLNRLNVRQWLSKTGYVPQTPYIYDGTLAENVAFGIEAEKQDVEWIQACCCMAAMDDFLNELPNNIETHIGERGIKLSGGQRQRVSIARALYHKPDVLIFDEATSSLDSKSEKAIQETIYSFKGQQTLVIVAHRLSTVADCDQIIWLDKGKIMMQGETNSVIEKYKQHMNRAVKNADHGQQ